MANTLSGGALRDAAGALVVRGLPTAKLIWPGTGGTTTVGTQAALVAAIAAANPGDTIELSDGNYDLTAFVAVNKRLRIKAQNPKGAVVRGSAGGPPASANAETVPAHITYGFKCTTDGVWIEDIHFKWLGVAVDFDNCNDVVVQGCRFESCYDAGVSCFDGNRPRIHMNEFLDPYLAGDTPSTLTAAGSIVDAQMDYGCLIYGSIDARVTHNYFFGVFNQACAFKEGNVNPYAGFNTFEGFSLSALLFGQNLPANGPYEHAGLPTGLDIGQIVAEYNVFRPVQSAAKTYRAGSAIRVWHVNGDTVLRGNLIECAVAGIAIEGVEGAQVGYAKGTVLIDSNVVGGALNDIGGVQRDVAAAGIRLYKGVPARIWLADNLCVNHYDAPIDYCADFGGLGACPVYTETRPRTLPVLTGSQLLKTAAVALDPDFSWSAGM